MLLALARLWLRGYRRVVIVCPKTAISVWKRQARLHLNIPYEMVDIDEAVTIIASGGLQFLLINYEMTWRPKAQAIVKHFGPEVFIIDEGHRAKSHKSRQSIAVWQLAEACGCEYRWDATGSPTDEDEVDLWAQFRFINPTLLGDDWKEFERRWLRKAGFGFFKRKLKKHLKAKYLNLLAPYTFAITRKEALDLPPEQDYLVTFKLTGEAKRAYQELEENLMVEIGDEVVVTPMTMTKVIKLQQITGGFLPTDDAMIRLEQDKLAALDDWIQDYPKTKIVIFCRFSEEIKAIAWLLRKRHRTVGILEGATKDRTIWERFQDRRDPEVLVIQEKTGGESIEVSVADIGVFYSRSFSYLTYDQCRARLLGRRKKVMFVHFAAENTIDTDLITVVDRKGRSARDILSELKRRRDTL